MSREPLFGVCYLLVRKRTRGGYNGHALVFRAFDKPPKPGPGEYVLKLRVTVPPKCFERESGYIDVTAAAPPDPQVVPE